MKTKTILAFLAISGIARAVGMVQQSTQQVGSSGIYTVALYWTGDSVNGTVPVTLVQSQSIPLVQGYRVVNMETTPGSPAPTNNYSIALLDAAGVDVMAGAASADVSSSSAQGFVGSPSSPPIFGSISLSITGQSVAGAKGTVFVYLAPFSQVIGLAPTTPNFPAQGADLVYSSPCNASGSPGFRALCAQDLTLAGLLASANAWTNNNTYTGGTIDLHGSTKTLPNRSGTGSPNGRDNCATVGETYFQTDATAGQNVWGCTTVGSPGTWTVEGNSLPTGTQTQFLRLQPNTGNNTTLQFATKDYVNVVDYNFPAQTPGGSLSAGSNTITLTPCPLGVNGTDTNHFIYISGGVGTAEADAITGGSCTSGASTGTITFTAGGTHSGAWNVSSATVGIKEAANVSPTIFIPDGTYVLQSEIDVTGDTNVICASNHAILQANTATQNILVSTVTTTTQRFKVSNCNFSTAPTKTAGDAIQLNGAGGVSGKGAVMDSILCQGQWNCIHSVSAGQWSIVSAHIVAGHNFDIYIQNTNGTDAGDNSIVNTFIDNSVTTGVGIEWESGGGLYIANTKILNHTYSINIAAADGVNTSDFVITNCSLELFSGVAVRVVRLNTTGLVQTVLVTGSQIASATGSNIGISVGAGTTNMSISNNIISATTTGVNIASTNGIKIQGNRISGSTNGILFSSGNSGSLEVSDNQMIGTTTQYLGTSTFIDMISGLTFAQITSGSLGPSNGSQIFCTDCNATCTAGASTGRTCFRENGAWTH
jgi:hypothetical protein